MFSAITHANRVCSWQENLGQDEIPPPWMWPHEGRLEEWFDEVEQRREAKYSGDGNDPSEEIVPLEQNEYAIGLRD